MRRASTARTWPRCSPSAPPGRRRREADGRRGHRQRHAVRARRRGAQAAHPFPARRSRPHRQPHRLRHRQLRRLLGHPRRQAREELHAARSPGGRERDRDRRGARRRRQAHRAAAGVHRAPRAAVRLLHAGDAHERDCSAARERQPERGGHPQAREGAGQLPGALSAGRSLAPVRDGPDEHPPGRKPGGLHRHRILVEEGGQGGRKARAGEHRCFDRERELLPRPAAAGAEARSRGGLRPHHHEQHDLRHGMAP